MPMFDDEGRLMVSLARVDRIVDADGDTYALAAEDYLDFFAAGNRYVRIDANGLLVTEYLRHYGDLDTYLRFTDDRLRVVVGNVDILDITEAATDTVVWNEGGVDIDHRWEGVGAPNALFIQGSDGKIGIGTNTVPHGGVGAAMLALEGANASVNGPHVQFTTASDDYPLLMIRPWTHDNVRLYFDSYQDGAERSSDAGSNFRISKRNDLLEFGYDSGVAQGAVITWNTGIVLDTSGKVFINDTANAFALGPSLTIDGAGQDGEYLALQDSTKVAHGMTAITETETFAMIKKQSASKGGLDMLGFTEDSIGIFITANITSCPVGKAAGSNSANIIFAYKKSGTGLGNVDAGTNILGVACQTGGGFRNAAIFSEDGDLYLDTVVNANHWDEFNDAELLRAGRLSLRPEDDPIRKQFGWLINKFKPTLQKFGLMHYNDDGHHFMAMKKWVQLNADCNWQNYTGLQETKAIVEDHDQKLKIYERAFQKISKVLGIPQKELLALTN